MKTNSKTLWRGMISGIAAIALLVGCNQQEQEVDLLSKFVCTPLQSQPEGFGSKVDFTIPRTIVAVIGASNQDGSISFTQKLRVLEGNAEGSEISKTIEELSEGQTAPVEYSGPDVMDARGALDIDLDNVNGQIMKGSAKVVLSFAPSNWTFSTKSGVLNFKKDGNPNTTGTPEFFELSTCDKSARTVSVLNRNATNLQYYFNYEAEISGRQTVTIDPGSDNNGTGPGGG